MNDSCRMEWEKCVPRMSRNRFRTEMEKERQYYNWIQVKRNKNHVQQKKMKRKKITVEYFFK